MPPEAKIFCVEDDSISLEHLTIILERHDHTVAKVATNLKDALKEIPNLNNLGVNIAIVDGNLSEWSQDGSDGELVIREIKKQHPNIIVIGHSLDIPLRGADYNSIKEDGFDKLIETIKNA